MGLTFNITYDSSVSSAPAGFKAAVAAATQAYESLFSDPITINIQVGYGEIMGQSLGDGALGESMFYQSAYSYSQVRNALISDSTSATDQSAVNSLSSADPTNGATILTTSAEAKALGLSTASTAIDGYVGFSSVYPFSYDPNQRAVAGAYDLIGVVEHEISEVMGRISEVSTRIGNALSVLDLFRYSAPGVRQFVGGQPAYFSVNGGGTSLLYFNANANGDYGDWAASAGNDAFLAMSGSGVVNGLSQTDIAELDALGYDTAAPAGTPTPATPPAPAPGSPPPTVTVAGAIAAFSANHQMAAVTISDSAANVNAGLDALQPLALASKLTSIVFAAAANALTVTAAQLSNDAAAISVIASNYTLSVTNVSASSAASIAALPHVTSIAVSDSAAHVSSTLDGLQSLAASGKIASITLTDAGTPIVAATASQLKADSAALGRIGSAYGLAVSGLTAATAMLIATQPHIATLAVSDSAVNVVANLDGLQVLATSHKLSGVALTGTGTQSLSITAAQFAADAAALNAISTPFALNITGINVAGANAILANPQVASVSVSDSAANVNAGLDALQQLVGQHRLSSISLTPTSAPSAANYYYYYYYYSYAVAPPTVPTLTVTAAQLGRDAGAIAAITSAFNMSVSGLSAASAAAVAALPHVTSVTISDSAVNIASNLDGLQPLAASGKITSITLTDSGTPVLAVTANQFKADSSVLGKITSTYNLAVNAASVTTAMSMATQAHVASVSVSDSATNVAANLDGLQVLAANHKLAAISLLGAGPQTLSITAAQVAADSAALHAISTAYALNVTGVSVAGASSVLANAQVASVSVNDTVANVSAGLDSLQQLASQHKLSAITLSLPAAVNSYYSYFYSAAPTPIVPTLALTAAQLSRDTGALAAITSTYHMTVSGVGAASAAMIAALPHVTSIALSDSAVNVIASLDQLQTFATTGKLTSIALTDSGTPTLTLSAALQTADAAALQKIVTPFTVHVVGTSQPGSAAQSVALTTVSNLMPTAASPGVFINAVSGFAPPSAAATFYSQPNAQENGMSALLVRPQA